jgi:hypothetical protein
MDASVTPPKAGMQPSTANTQLMQLTTAYWTSRCLHVVAELGVADHLGDQPQSTESLAKATGASAGPLYRLLRLLASVGVFEWKDGTWHHTEASRFLRSDEPGSLRDYVRMLGLTIFWSAFEDLDHSLRTGESACRQETPRRRFRLPSQEPGREPNLRCGDDIEIAPRYRHPPASLRFLAICNHRGHRRRTRPPAPRHSQGLS